MSRAGRYELLRPLARGGMAEVFLARRRAAGIEKVFVVKRMRPERLGDARFHDLFVREARVSMSLTHQNIVPVFDFGRLDDQVFLAMERVEGKDLGSSLARAGAAHPLPPLVAAFVAAECCQALAYAHGRRGADGAELGIVHRDVTPRNVLLSWSGEVKLTDFGIAALAGDAGARLLGTPAYMAPEQARGEPLDARADVYAIGLVLREALTGVRAREGADREALVEAARGGALAPWPAGDWGRLQELVERATAARVDARYASAAALLADLDAFSVAERAAHRGEAPARQLAAWLAAVWAGHVDEPMGDGALPGSQESFLDDGELDAVGTGTEHSMAATAADEGAAVAPAPTSRRTRGAWVVAAMAAITAVAVFAVVLAMPGRGAKEVPPSRVAAVLADAAPIAADAAPPAVAIDALALPDAAMHAVPHVAAHPHAPPPLAPLAPRKVTIGAKPWASFTVDADRTEHQTVETLSLAPGPHVLHFSNPQLGVTRDAHIDVPADRDLSYVEDLQN